MLFFFLVEFSRKEIFVKNPLSLHAISCVSGITKPSIFNWSSKIRGFVRTILHRFNLLP